MARKKSIANETLSTSRRRSPRFIPQQFNPKPSESNPILHPLSTPLSSNKCTNLRGPHCKIVAKLSPSKLRRSFRLREIKEKQKGTENFASGKIGGDFNRVSVDLGKSGFGGLNSEESRRRVVGKFGKNGELGNVVLCKVVKRVTRSGGIRNGGFDYESLERGGCKDDSFKRFGESELVAKRVTRSGSLRNGSKWERNRNVDCKVGGDCLLSEVFEGEDFDLIGKRITRSGSLRNGSECEERNGDVDFNAGDNHRLFEGMDKGGFKDERLKRVVKESTLIAKRVTRSASLRNGSRYDKRVRYEGDNGLLCENVDGGVLRNEKSKRVEESSLGDAKEENAGKKQVGQKRKKDQQKGECGCSNGWTREQEVALQKAYFAVKPTPHFWKKVAKMVPGKSAQDCFDRIHSDQKTPQTRKLTRAKKVTPSSLLSFTASKLLSSATKGTRKSKFTNRNRHLAQKTVRQLLQKQGCVDKDGADLFSILETTVDPSNGFSQHYAPCSTPQQTKKGLNFLNVCQGTFSTSHRKQLSRLSNSSGASLTSPPVLKQIRNMALHEKYIDQLHCREAKRKVTVARLAKQVKSNIEDNKVHGGNIKAARNALFFDATEAINQFQQSQKATVDSWDLCDDEMPCSDEDE